MDDARAFAAACAGGDPAARRAFLERFAEDVYNFPVKIYGVSAEHAADFYLYAFERDRIFTRLRSFEGRNAIQLRTFLAYYVLRALFLDWQRGRRELETVSMDSEPGPEGGRPWVTGWPRRWPTTRRPPEPTRERWPRCGLASRRRSAST